MRNFFSPVDLTVFFFSWIGCGALKFLIPFAVRLVFWILLLSIQIAVRIGFLLLDGKPGYDSSRRNLLRSTNRLDLVVLAQNGIRDLSRKNKTESDKVMLMVFVCFDLAGSDRDLPIRPCFQTLAFFFFQSNRASRLQRRTNRKKPFS
jgi:hypothetical protein